MAPLYNRLIEKPAIRHLVSRIGIVNPPRIKRVDRQCARRLQALRLRDVGEILHLPEEVRSRTVALLPELFNGHLDERVISAAVAVISWLGFSVRIMPYRPTGKIHYLLGKREAFQHHHNRQKRDIRSLSSAGIKVVCIEPAIRAMFRRTRSAYLASSNPMQVVSIEAWLAENLKSATCPRVGHPISLFLHCSERSTEVEAAWRNIFRHFDAPVKFPKVGCCGMAGYFGHVTANDETSAGIFGQSWEPALSASLTCGELALATGYSCRSQAQIRGEVDLLHPLLLLEELLAQPEDEPCERNRKI